MSEEDIRVHIVKEKDRTNFSMRFRDPLTGRLGMRSTGTSKRKEAEKRAAQWEAELREGRYHAPLRVSWEEFRSRFEEEELVPRQV
jgi:hypothetical protein